MDKITGYELVTYDDDDFSRLNTEIFINLETAKKMKENYIKRDNDKGDWGRYYYAIHNVNIFLN